MAPRRLLELELADDLGADVGLAEADHVADEAAAVLVDHLEGAADGVELEVGELGTPRRPGSSSGVSISSLYSS